MVYAIPPLLRKQLEFKELTSGQTFHFQCLEVFSELVEVPLHFIVVPPSSTGKKAGVELRGRVGHPLGTSDFAFFCGGVREDDGGVFVGILIDCPPDRRQLAPSLALFHCCSRFTIRQLFLLSLRQTIHPQKKSRQKF